MKTLLTTTFALGVLAMLAEDAKALDFKAPTFQLARGGRGGEHHMEESRPEERSIERRPAEETHQDISKESNINRGEWEGGNAGYGDEGAGWTGAGYCEPGDPFCNS